ncbi:Adenine specific DNA methyltransferase, D12 class [Fulvimarina pelagi HTCC2506]|uniref:site-specific DNA-methyltransferase (adenine-specific) n=1 Tax=Fulvimarina pelagi HTCC2506 TaxID=314231 RepID=Q0FZ19_9HYPH|nr:DNA adenine methylase [Fulvimarina pelagi]EAU40139.1 Adenine specific DNA methyltransferase, D12 class [Fulvimarina pelagi HTCC2506]
MTDFLEVEPVQPAAGYRGGKRNLAKRLIQRIEAVPHIAYAEVFVGMGGIFLRRRRVPKAETINDRSGDVANFFRILQRHHTPFIEMLRYQVASRREFERLKAERPETLTDLERAARFLYLQRLAFGGKIVGRSFGYTPTRTSSFNPLTLAPQLQAIHERLAGVVIEELDWADFIRRYDRPGMLFYLDPPYWDGEDDYGVGVFGREDFAEMAEQLRDLKGRFILSINDRPEVREIFSDFAMEAVEASYSLAREKRRAFGELIVSGTGRA